MLHDNHSLLPRPLTLLLASGLIGLISLTLMGCNPPTAQTTPRLNLSDEIRAVDSLQRMEAALPLSERPVFEAALYSLITTITLRDISVWARSVTDGVSSAHALSLVQLNSMTAHDIMEAASEQR